MPYQYSNNDLELTLDECEPKRDFENLIYNKSYHLHINQWGYGTGKHMKGGFTNILITRERVLYIKDNDSKEVFSVGYAPVFSAPQSFECTSGLNYQIIKNKTLDIEVLWRIYVPAGIDPVEIWDVKVVNKSSRTRSLSLYTYGQMTCDGVDLYCGALYRYAAYNEELCGIYVLQDAEVHDKIDFPLHNGFFSSQIKPDSWCAHEATFIGKKNTIQNPLGVSLPQLGNNYSSRDIPCTALHFNISLQPDAEWLNRFVCGAADKENMAIALKSKYSGNLYNDPHFVELAAERTRMISNIQIATPEPSINTMLGSWTKQQIHYGATWVRWGIKGYRDIVQQSQGILTQDPQLAKENLREALHYQYNDGFALRGWDPIDTMRYADSAQWCISAICEYIKETGDFNFLNESIAYFDSGEETVYGHFQKTLARLRADRGAHGLSLAFFGDWNDSLTGVCREGKGESVWLSMAFCRSLLIMEELALYLNKLDDAAMYRGWYDEMKKAINDHAWDGSWYLCALDDKGEPIGSLKNKEGQIYLNMQSWAQLGGIADTERFEKAWKSVTDRLDSGWGLMLNDPAYTYPQKNVGRLSYIRPGICENASVYTHGNAFMMLALLERGKADEALKIWKNIEPGNPNRPAKCQPNVFVNGFFGPSSDIEVGRAEHLWVTGSATWMYFCVLEYMLGVRRTYDGLVISPHLPTGWKNVSVSRDYRGTSYEIVIKNEKGIENAPVKSIQVDGVLHPSDKPLPIDGKAHFVEVVCEK